jgi:hypothetical protein
VTVDENEKKRDRIRRDSLKSEQFERFLIKTQEDEGEREQLIVVNSF